MNRKAKTSHIPLSYPVAALIGVLLIITGVFTYGYLARQGDLNHIKQAYTVHIPQSLQLIRHEQSRGGVDQAPFILNMYRPKELRQPTFDELKAAFTTAGFTVDGTDAGFSTTNNQRDVTALVSFYTSVDNLGTDDNGSPVIKQVGIEVQKL